MLCSQTSQFRRMTVPASPGTSSPRRIVAFLLGLLDPEDASTVILPKCREPHLIQCHSVTSQETWNLSNIAVRTSNFTLQSMYHNHHNWKHGSECNKHILYDMWLPIWTWCPVLSALMRPFDRTLWPQATVHTQSLSILTSRGKISSQILNATKDCLPLIMLYFICSKMNVFSHMCIN